VINVHGEALAPLAIGCALMVMVYMGGHVSGAHYNPAVSLAVFLRGKMAVPDLVFYIVAQLLGALAACAAGYFALNGGTTPIRPAANVEPIRAVAIEALFTFALALVVLNVTTSKHTTGNSYFGMAIGFTIVVAAFAGGPISGGAFNPAVGTGLTVTHALWSNGGWNDLWIYWVGPLLGGLVAALVFAIQES
jgi:aquaporin Z